MFSEFWMELQLNEDGKKFSAHFSRQNFSTKRVKEKVKHDLFKYPLNLINPGTQLNYCAILTNAKFLIKSRHSLQLRREIQFLIALLKVERSSHCL